MKSVALSLLAAFALTLGSQAASAADVTPRPGAVMMTTSGPKESLQLASFHAQRALTHREAARASTALAVHAMKIAADDEAQGFTYQAGVQRERARQHRLRAEASTLAAVRDEALATYYRRLAQQQTAAQGPTLSRR